MVVDQRTRVGWDIRFLGLAEHIAQWSKDPSTKIGAVIVCPDRRVLSVGYNGFAQGVDDSPELYANREEKLDLIVHGELNAILFADRLQLRGSTLYTWPWQPCSRCAGPIVQAGITRVVSIKADDAVIARWGASLVRAAKQFEDAGVELRTYDDEKKLHLERLNAK